MFAAVSHGTREVREARVFCSYGLKLLFCSFPHVTLESMRWLVPLLLGVRDTFHCMVPGGTGCSTDQKWHPIRSLSCHFNEEKFLRFDKHGHVRDDTERFVEEDGPEMDPIRVYNDTLQPARWRDTGVSLRSVTRLGPPYIKDSLSRLRITFAFDSLLELETLCCFSQQRKSMRSTANRRKACNRVAAHRR